MSDPTLLRRALGGTPYRVVPTRITPLMVSLLLPLRAGDWQGALAELRDQVGDRLGQEAGWFPLLPDDLFVLSARLEALHRPDERRSPHAFA